MRASADAATPDALGFGRYAGKSVTSRWGRSAARAGANRAGYGAAVIERRRSHIGHGLELVTDWSGRIGSVSWEEWNWDESLFAGTAPYYDSGRLPYSLALAEVFEQALELDGRGRLLDVGCGPGTIARSVAHLFDVVVGLDPDAGMLAEAERLATDQDVDNATWVRLRAEELPAGLGLFRVVTFAQSFHWMDRSRVAAAVRMMIDPDGVVVHVDSGHRDLLWDPPFPEAAIEELRVRWLGRDRRAGQSIRNTSPSGEPEVFAAAGFAAPTVVAVPDGRLLERTIDDLVAERFASSGTAPHLFGEQLAEFEGELRDILVAASPSGRYSVRLPDNLLYVYRLRE
jgi:SAM-dependent methyltransferase